MMFLLVLALFTATSLIFWAGFVLYASLLLIFGRLGNIARVIGGGATYLAFALLLVLPILIGLSINNWREAFNENFWFMFFFMACYILSILPGGIFFKKHYLQKLKTAGYFRERKHRL